MEILTYDEGNEEEAEENESLPIIDYDMSEDELDDYSRKPSPDDIPVKLISNTNKNISVKV